MSNFFDAYIKRCKRVEQELKVVSEELKASGCVVYGNRNGTLSFLKVYKNGQSLVYGFAEVPYRWYVENEVDPKKKQGSAKVVLQDYGNHSLSAEKVLKNLGESFSSKKTLEELDRKNWYLNRH